MRSVGEEIFIKVTKAGYIPQLGMQGPIPNPIKVKRAVVHSMIVSGIKVFEYDPETKETTEITLGSLYNEEPAKEGKTDKSESPATPDPIQPVNLQGVTAPIKEENGINVDATPVDPKDSTPEEIKPEENASTDTNEEPVNEESTGSEEDKTSNSNKKKNKNKKN